MRRPGEGNPEVGGVRRGLLRGPLMVVSLYLVVRGWYPTLKA